MRKTLFAALVALFFASQAGWAQFETAEITGTARDQTGAVIPGVRVTALHVSTGTKVETSTEPGLARSLCSSRTSSALP